VNGEKKHSLDPEELGKRLAAYRAEFAEQHKVLEAGLARIDAKLAELGRAVSHPPFWEPSAATKEADAKLKALQEYVRNLPPRS
jgi:septation ring formation regulator EzrA